MLRDFAYLNELKDSDELVIRQSASSTAIKAMGDGKIGGYLVVWGSPNERDLQGEYFTPETDLGLEWYGERPVLYHHGLDGDLETEVIGVIKTLRPDKVGLWAEAQLDMHKHYVQTVLRLVDKGVLGWSSGSVPHLTIVTKDGEIKRWPIVEGSLTPAPAQPYKTTVGSIKSALAQSNPPATEAEEPSTEAGTPAEESTAIEQSSGKAAGDINPNEQNPREVIKMNPREMLLGLLTVLLQSKPEWQMTPEEQGALVDAVLSQMQAADATMSAPIPTEQVQAVTMKASTAVLNAATKFFNDRAAAQVENQRKIQDAMKFAMAAQPPANPAPAFTGNGGNGGTTPPPNPQAENRRIEMRTKYADLSAEDMSFLVMLDRTNRRSNNSNLKPYIKDDDYGLFMAELADKAQKAVDSRKLEADVTAIKGMKMLAAKANELSHSTQAGFGDEWVPELWSNDLWRKARMDNVVLPLFRTIDMPSDPFTLPVEGADPTVHLVPETTNENQLALDNANNPIPDSKIGSGKVTMAAKKLGLRVGFSAELVEDAIIPVLNLYREQADRAIRDAIDFVLLNGDDTNAGTGNINSDDADPADTEKYLAFNGLLHSPLVEDTSRRMDAGGASPTLAMIRAMRFKMPATYSQKMSDIAYIVPGEVYANLLGINEFLTVDKLGPKATVLTGEIGAIDMSPVLVSDQFGLAEADGKRSAVTPANNILGRALAVYRPNWFVGYRRRIAISVDYLPYYDSYQLTATVRLAFVHMDDDSASALYNINVT